MHFKKIFRQKFNIHNWLKRIIFRGELLLDFGVTSGGGVSQISIHKGVDPLLNDEAIRVVKTVSKFKPGKQGGKPVPVWYMVPVSFKLN